MVADRGGEKPDSALSRWFVERTAGARGGMRKVMIVALARKLLVALWRYVETGEVPHGRPARRGLRHRKQEDAHA